MLTQKQSITRYSGFKKLCNFDNSMQKMKVSNNPESIKYICFRLIVLIFALILEGCAHLYYLPSNHNVPLLKEKNEFHGSISIGGSPVMSGSDVQAALALTDHLAIMTNYMSSKYPDDLDDKNQANGKYLEGAAGYFNLFNRFYVFEVYGGFGSCFQHHEYYDALHNNTYLGKSDLTFVKSFLQPSIGVTFNAFDIALTSGFSRINFNKLKYSVDQNSRYYDELDMISKNRTSFLFEPGITIRGGWKIVKIQFQYLRSINLSTDALNFEPIKYSLGIYISLSKNYWNDKEKNN
jgi:hypothetical protein